MVIYFMNVFLRFLPFVSLVKFVKTGHVSRGMVGTGVVFFGYLTEYNAFRTGRVNEVAVAYVHAYMRHA